MRQRGNEAEREEVGRRMRLQMTWNNKNNSVQNLLLSMTLRTNDHFEHLWRQKTKREQDNVSHKVKKERKEMHCTSFLFSHTPYSPLPPSPRLGRNILFLLASSQAVVYCSVSSWYRFSDALSALKKREEGERRIREEKRDKEEKKWSRKRRNDTEGGIGNNSWIERRNTEIRIRKKEK